MPFIGGRQLKKVSSPDLTSQITGFMFSYVE